MKLHDAMRKTIRKFGADVLGEKRLMFILSDFSAFEEYPAEKKVLETLVSDGSGKKLAGLSLDDDTRGCLAFARDLKESLCREKHFRKDLSGYAVDSILFALGLQSSVTEPQYHGFDPEDHGGAWHGSAVAGQKGADEKQRVSSYERRSAGSGGNKGLEQPGTGAERRFSAAGARERLTRKTAAPESHVAGASAAVSAPFHGNAEGRNSSNDMKWLIAAAFLAIIFVSWLGAGNSYHQQYTAPAYETAVSTSGNTGVHGSAVIQVSDSDLNKGLAGQNYGRAFRESNQASSNQAAERVGNSGLAADGTGKYPGQYEFEQGESYYYGRGVRQDFAEAVKWYQKSAERGNPDLQTNLGLMYKYGVLVRRDDAEAVKWFKKAAEQGNATAQVNLGWMYEKGRGVSRNYAESVKWYHKAAEQGHAYAQNSLGVMYEKGRGVSKNYFEAARWFMKSVEHGYYRAQENLYWMQKNSMLAGRDFAEAAKLLRKSAEHGDPQAQNNLGWFYYYGVGVILDNAEAVKWFKKAAEQGNVPAQNNLGWMYYSGKGVGLDYAEAVKWFKKAAEQGSVPAQSNLGHMFEYGLGVSKDYAEALKWYMKAAEQVNATALYNLGWMYERGLGVSMNYAEALKWYMKEAAQELYGTNDTGEVLKRVEQLMSGGRQ